MAMDREEMKLEIDHVYMGEVTNGSEYRAAMDALGLAVTSGVRSSLGVLTEERLMNAACRMALRTSPNGWM